MNTQHHYHPIIYVRGFAATQGEIEEAVADPYMGFNIGATKTRMAWTGGGLAIEQNTRPGLKGSLRIEARPWS